MGKAYSMLLRPLRTFNIENRAAKIISLEKPIAAPQHKHIEKQKKLVDEVNPNFLRDHYRKDMQLDQRLKDVFITSIDPQGIKRSEESKSLPQNRFNTENIITSNYHEPIVIPIGKCSLKQAITFLKKHKEDPITHNIENIAVEYKMDKKIVGDILKHFNLFVMTPTRHKIESPETDIALEEINKNK